MQNEIAKHNLKPGDKLYHIENIGKVHEIILNKDHFECNHTYFNNPSPIIYNYTLKPNESVIEIEDHSLMLWITIQENGKVEYIPVLSHTYLDKEIAEKVAAKIKDVREKLGFAKIYNKLVFMHPISHRYMTILDVKSEFIKENLEKWQKQYEYEQIPFRLYFKNEFSEIFAYDELQERFIEYQKALKEKDELGIELY